MWMDLQSTSYFKEEKKTPNHLLVNKMSGFVWPYNTWWQNKNYTFDPLSSGENNPKEFWESV